MIFFPIRQNPFSFLNRLTDSREYLEGILLIIISYIITFINGYLRSLIKCKESLVEVFSSILIKTWLISLPIRSATAQFQGYEGSVRDLNLSGVRNIPFSLNFPLAKGWWNQYHSSPRLKKEL